MKTPSSMKPPKQPAAKGGQPLPPGAHNVPGSRTYRALQKAPHPGTVQIDKSFVADHRGGPELIIGKKTLEMRDNRTRSPR
jgi:hypothetical protein